MDLKNIIFLLFLLFFCFDISLALPLNYTYSATGNRKQCYVGFAKIAVSPDEQEEYIETLDSIQFNIYPNPTKGLLKISIETGKKIESLNIELYDISGNQIISKSLAKKEIELDITRALSGNYFLKVFVNDKPYY